MASAQGIRAGRAFVELFADDSKLVRGLRAAEKKLKAFGDSVRNMGLKLAGLGSAIAAPLLASTKLFAKMGDDLAKMSARTGFTVETLSELGFAADLSGASMEVLENGIRKMQRTLVDAASGSKSAQESLAMLGLTVADLDKLSPEQQFKLIADRLASIEDPTIKAAVAMDVFGRSGTQLLPMLAGGAAGIEQLQEQARKLGLTISTEDAKAAEQFNDTLDILWKVLKQGVFIIGSALVPVLTQAAQWMTRVAVTVGAWIKQNQQIVVTVLKVAVVVVAVGIALTVLGTIISGLGSMLGVLITVITTVVAVIKVLAAVIAFLISPIGLVIAGVTALGAYLVYATDIGAKALQWLGERFNVLKDDAMSAYQGIADALAAGDISLAVKILWLTIKMEWTRGVNFLEKAWLNFRNFFIKIGYDAWHGLLAVAEIVWHGLEVGWIETTAFFSKLWTDFTSFFAETWENIKAGAQKAWNWIKSLFDDSVDLESENKMVEEQKQAAIARIEDEQQRKTAQREAQREAERRRASAIHEGTLGEIGRENMEKHRDLDTEYANRMAENEADLAKARQEWRDAIDAAKKKRQEKEAAEPGGLEGPDDIINKARDALAGLGDIGDLVQQEAAKIGVKGTFNAAAVQGLAAGDAADRTAKASEETARNTKKLVQAATTGGLTFA